MELPHRGNFFFFFFKVTWNIKTTSQLQAKRKHDHLLRLPSMSACAFRFRKPFWNTVAFLSWARSWKGLLFERRDASRSTSCSKVIEVSNSFSSLDENTKENRGLEGRGNINSRQEMSKTVIKDGLTLPTQAGDSWLSYKESGRYYWRINQWRKIYFFFWRFVE